MNCRKKSKKKKKKKISENTLHMYKLKVKKFQHASINHKKVIKKKPTGGVNLPPPPPPCTIGLSDLFFTFSHYGSPYWDTGEIGFLRY